jgi:hypothetical protein
MRSARLFAILLAGFAVCCPRLPFACSHAGQSADGPSPVPDDRAVTDAKQVVRDLFAEDYSQAKTDEQKLEVDGPRQGQRGESTQNVGRPNPRRGNRIAGANAAGHGLRVL